MTFFYSANFSANIQYAVWAWSVSPNCEIPPGLVFSKIAAK